MNQLTPTVKQMFSLIKNGLNCDHASATFCVDENGNWHIVRRPYLSFCETFRKYCCIPAFTIEDMYQMLPPNIGKYKLSVYRVGDKECVQYEDVSTKLGLLYVYEDTRVGAAYTAIQMLMSDGTIKTNKTVNDDERPIPGKCSVAR